MTTRLAKSQTVTAKAKSLAVRYEGSGRFSVMSGSRFGLVHEVLADHQLGDLTGWQCDCEWAEHGGRNCSHVQAAARYAVGQLRRQVRQGVTA